MFSIGFGEGIRFFIITDFVGAAKKQPELSQLKMHSKKLVQLKKRKIILTTSLVESVYTNASIFPKMRKCRKGNGVTKTL